MHVRTTYLASDKTDLDVFVGVNLSMVHSYNLPYILYWSRKNGCVEQQRNENCACISNKIVTDAEYYTEYTNIIYIIILNTISSSGWCYTNVIRVCQAVNQKFGWDRKLNLEREEQERACNNI